MTNEEWIALHRALDRISPPNNIPDELLSWMERQPPEGHPDRAEWDRLTALRHLCRFCDAEDTEYYILQRPGLWDAIAPRLVKLDDGTEYLCSSGYVCIACLAERAPGYRLYREDFGLSRGDDQPPLGEIEGIAEGKSVQYSLHFPSKRKNAKQAINVETEFAGNGEWTEADWDAGWNAVFDATYWLDDYCRDLGLKLLINGQEQDISEPDDAAE
jgi:hypothetical protein